ncbi:LacI family DNA-binding transcriptional regulator [Kribbella sp. NPDC050124]|uniref:LacI family DNA-binding transcriptional regulator n=1 Tax=Kribbella sp. NPDC050124 TaxID=3364114 RepID=UPI0037B8BF9E
MTSNSQARAAMRQVADRAGVAVSSVSRVLSGHPDVSESMRARVMAAVEELRYEPNVLGQMLRLGATQTIGFVIGDISNPLLSEIALGAETELGRAGFSMILTNSVNDPARDASNITLLQRRQVDGFLLSVADETNGETVSAVGKLTAPCVLIDRELPLEEPASAVLSDHASGISAAAKHLITLGHKTIALVAGSPHVRPGRERIAAIEDVAAQRSGVQCYVRAGAFNATHGAAATRDLLEARRPPTAIVVGGNQILAGVLRELADRTLEVGTDISIVTCDDVPLAGLLRPAIATVRREPYEMGAEAARLLLARLGGEPAKTVVLPTRFETAASCAPPRRTRRSPGRAAP